MQHKTLNTLQVYIGYLEKEHGGKFSILPSQVGGTVALIECNKFDMVLTICAGYQGKYCIKIEEIMVENKYRGQGICTRLLNMLKLLAKKTGVKIGLWVEKDRQDLIDFYLKREFKIKETVKDVWLEYN